ncbi:MAG: prepilin-type N-terminal cleavage/methylation domain-containing protein, partial [Motiliproteus sp.]
MNNQPNYNKQQGVSLVELMISLVISSLLMLGVFEVFLGSSNTDRVAHAFARIQENGRLAMDILSRNVRMAGYQGCIDPALIDMNIIADNPPTIDLGNDGIKGYETDST